MRRTGDDISSILQEPGAPWAPRFSVERVIQVLTPFVTEGRRARIMRSIERRIGSVALLLDGVRDPYNGAALLRSCDAFGVQNVHLVEREQSFVISRRVTQGADHWLNLHHHQTPGLALDAIREAGFELVLTHPNGALLPQELSLIPRICLILGNEHEGVREPLVSACTHSVRVPMRGFSESLNVSVTGGILLAHATQGREGDLESCQQRQLYARGLYRTVSRADKVLQSAGIGSTAGAFSGTSAPIRG